MDPFEFKLIVDNSLNENLLREYQNQLNFGEFITEGINSSTAITQKARGVLFLMNKSKPLANALGWYVPKHFCFKAGKNFGASSFNYPVFARPCPTVPRHGFVDSTVCKNSQEVNALSNKTKQVEPDAEILITKPVAAIYNLVIAGGNISFARGHDGATSGVNVKNLYISEDPIAQAISLEKGIIAEGEVPFYEIVMDKSKGIYLVQARSGPGLPLAKDYVASTVKVEKILKAEGDLLDWEELLKTVDPKTTIIDHTNGSLASHYAIHALVNKVPIFTTWLPKIGDVVEPTVSNSEITEEDVAKFKKAFAQGFASAEYIKDNLSLEKLDTFTFMRAIIRIALSVLHNYSTVAMNKDFDLLGVALGLFVRVTFSTSCGEARYASNKFGGGHPDLRIFHSKLPSGRQPCYDYMFKKPVKDCLDNIVPIYRIFNEVYWGSGYGGPKWANCTRSAVGLYNACVSGDIKSVVQLFNKVINEEHNGGKYLNKVISVSEFDVAANNPSLYTIKHLAESIDILYTAWGNKNVNLEEFQYINLPGKNEAKANDSAKTKPLPNSPVNAYGISKLKVKYNYEEMPVEVQVFGTKFPGGHIIIPANKFNTLGINIGMFKCKCGDPNCNTDLVGNNYSVDYSLLDGVSWTNNLDGNSILNYKLVYTIGVLIQENVANKNYVSPYNIDAQGILYHLNNTEKTEKTEKTENILKLDEEYEILKNQLQSKLLKLLKD